MAGTLKLISKQKCNNNINNNNSKCFFNFHNQIVIFGSTS